MSAFETQTDRGASPVAAYLNLFPFLLSIAAGVCLLGCSAEASVGRPTSTAPVGTLKVVSTVSPITSLVENIGGTRIRLQGIVPEGVNSHTFEPAPSVATVMSEADLIVLNGLFLEQPSLEMARANSKPGAVILSLGDEAITRDEWVFDFSFPESDGHPNPHLWTSPALALKYAELIRDELVGLDPDNAGYYAENYQTHSRSPHRGPRFSESRQRSTRSRLRIDGSFSPTMTPSRSSGVGTGLRSSEQSSRQTSQSPPRETSRD